MSAEFSNTYQEILLDNLMSIIKQNFIFQTQLKMMEDVGKQKAELEVKYNELAASFGQVQERLTDAENYKSIAKVNDSAHQEKQRIQAALNNEMKKSAGLTKEVESKEVEIGKLKEYILKLEEIAPASKLKKINPEKTAVILETKEPVPIDLFAIKENDGSSF